MNLTVGCKVEWTDSVNSPYVEGEASEFVGERTITGRITAEGYAKKTNYYFFTIHVYGATGVNADAVEVESKIIRRGMVLYPKCTLLATPPNYEEPVKKRLALAGEQELEEWIESTVRYYSKKSNHSDWLALHKKGCQASDPEYSMTF
ncbi:hypothetical protein ACFS7Z_15925 [Pontibacter toksunensis]|uniref:Arrestin-like N-terminal domain-containing protein n=1 Tax=Pontibacter toksunensis TaxID=1332631 RepID=A0ABW6C0N8_9BACT